MRQEFSERATYDELHSLLRESISGNVVKSLGIDSMVRNLLGRYDIRRKVSDDDAE